MSRAKCLLDAKGLRSKLAEGICKKIILDFPDLSSLVLIGIYTRGVYLARRIRQYIKQHTSFDLPLGEIDINLYRDDFVRRFDIPQVRQTNIPGGVENKGIVLVDDVIYTGRTVRAALDAIVDMGRPSFVKLAVLVDRPGREMPICADYIGLKLEPEIVKNRRVYVQLKEVDGQDQVSLR